MKRLSFLLLAVTICLGGNAQLLKNLGKSIQDSSTPKQETSKPASDATKFQADNTAVATLYVSKQTGKNKNDGSREAPLKNLQKAIDMAEPGTLILVAEGNYFGLHDCGTIKITKPVTIQGGYSQDFSERDILKHLTLVQPSAESNGTTLSGTLGTMHIEIPQKSDTKMEIDGLIFDRGYTNAYNPKGEGKPEGVASPMMQELPSTGGIGGDDEFSMSEIHNNDYYTLYVKVACPLVIRNCAFLNSRTQAIMGPISEGAKVLITNNIIVNSRMSGVEVWGTSATVNAQLEFSYNTVLFAWTRTRTFEDMGYGFRYMNKIDVDLHHNIIGCCCYAALDRCRIDSPSDREKKKVTTAEHNRFFLNKQADLMIPGGGKFQRIWADEFEDVDQLAKEDDNVTLSDPKALGGIDEAYLKGWLNLSYGETSSFDGNSGANQFRSALGMPQQGTMDSKASMWANRYPWRKALDLFGAMQGYGAQKIER